MRDGDGAGSGETGEMMRTVMDEGGDIYPAWPRFLHQGHTHGGGITQIRDGFHSTRRMKYRMSGLSGCSL